MGRIEIVASGRFWRVVLHGHLAKSRQDADLERRAAGPFHPRATKGPAITTPPPHQGARSPPPNTQWGGEKDLTYGKKWIRRVAVTK